MQSFFAAVAIFLASIFGFIGHALPHSATAPQPAAVVLADASATSQQQGIASSSGSATASGTGTTTVVNNYITQPVVEKIVQAPAADTASAGPALADLQNKIDQLQTELNSPTSTLAYGGLQNEISALSRIDNLAPSQNAPLTISGATISNATISNSSVNDSSVPLQSQIGQSLTVDSGQTIAAGSVVSLAQDGNLQEGFGPAIGAITAIATTTSYRNLQYVKLDSFHFLVQYQDSTNNNYDTAVACSVSGTTVTCGTPVLDGAGSINGSLTDLDSTHVVFQYRDWANNGYDTAIVCSTSGTTVTCGTHGA